MTKLKLLSAALIAAVVLAAPAMARESHVTSRHLAEDANASITPGARYIDGGDRFRSHHFGGGFGGTPGDGHSGYVNGASGLHDEFLGYGGRNVWGHCGTYYGPTVPTPL
jgi:hypothetical protein